MNSKYDSGKLERTATLEWKGGQAVTSGQQKHKGDRNGGYPAGMSMHLESGEATPGVSGNAGQSLGNRKITMDEPQI